MNHSDEVVVMAQGEMIAQGEPEDVRNDQDVIDAYLGGGPSAAEAEAAAHAAGARREETAMAEPVLQVEGADRRLHARGRHPQRRRDRGPRARDRHDRRAQRRRQVDADEVGLRPGPPREGSISCTARTSPAWRRTTSPAAGSATCRSSTTSSRASRSARTSSSARSPAAGTVDARDGADVRALPAARGAPRPGGRDDVRRRAPDGGDGPGADARAARSCCSTSPRPASPPRSSTRSSRR